MLPVRLVARVQAPAARPQPDRPPRAQAPRDVLALARPTVLDNRFSVRDRITLTRWSEVATRAGVTRVRLEEPEPRDDPQIGSFALIYRHGDDWATWGVARETTAAYLVWNMATGAVVGTAGSLAAALDALLKS